jgi:cytochrome c oxidase subunit 2
MNQMWPLPPLASEHGGDVDRALLLVILFIGSMFVGWTVFFFYTVRKFRVSKNPTASYAGTKSKLTFVLEACAVVLEVALLVGISLPFWQKRVVAMPTADQRPVEVRAVAQQFAWNFHYPGADGQFGKSDISLVNDVSNPLGLDRSDPACVDDIVTRNQLHLPLGRPAIVQVSSKDVVHSFSLPDFRVKQDAVPGLRTPVSFTPTMSTEEYAKLKGDPARTFEVVCAQLCGQGHYTMRGFVFVESEEAFAKWLEDSAPKPESEADAFFNN